MSGTQHTPLHAARSFTNERGNPATDHHVGIDEQVGPDNSMRIQAMNLGMQTEDTALTEGHSFLGASLNATGAGVTCEPKQGSNGGPWGGVKAFDAGVDLQAHQEGMNASYRADLISGEVGARDSNRHSARDGGTKVGLSFGMPSGGIRFHNEDLDNDGRSEIGPGVTIPVGPVGVSLDQVSETPFGDAAVMAADAASRFMGVPFGGSFLNGAADTLLGEERTPSVVFDEFMRSEVL